jgi:AhpD family alkylhydroperoxidase
MNESWTEFLAGLSGPSAELRGSAPEVMKGFSALARAAMEPGAIDTKMKELTALAIAVALCCKPCIAFHARGALRRGASRQEVVEMLGVAMQMGGGPAVMYAAEALEAFDQFAAKAAVAA